MTSAPGSRTALPLGGSPWKGPSLVPVMTHWAATVPPPHSAADSISKARSENAAKRPPAYSAVAAGPRPSGTFGSV